MTPLRPYLTRVMGGEPLSREEAAGAFAILMRGEAGPEETAALLGGMAARGETVEELTGFTETMRAFAVPVYVEDPEAIDVCGTGGDLSGTFNVSTCTAFVAAGAGVTVAKHGNRSVSSLTGSADVLEALGVNVGLRARGVELCIAKTGLGFLFAPLFHPALRHVMPVRRALGVRTAFNILGPLCNPANVKRQVVGAFHPRVAANIAGILARLGARRALALSAQGLDEASLSGDTHVFPVEQGQEAPSYTLTAEQAGLSPAPLEALKGGSADSNARLLLGVLNGVQGPRRDTVLLNTALALQTAGRADSLEDGIAQARESLDSGRAFERLKALVEVSHLAPGS